MDIESALERMVKTARKTHCVAEQMSAIGFGDEPFFSIFGDIADAIYCLIGEKTDSFSDSVTYRVLSDTMISIRKGVQMLMNEYNKNKENVA